MNTQNTTSQRHNIKETDNDLVPVHLPDNANFLVWLAHDVDCVHKTFIHSAYYFLKEKKAYHLESYIKNHQSYWNFDKILEIEAKNDVRSTFFFLSGDRRLNLLDPKSWLPTLGGYKSSDPALRFYIDYFDKEGWEIGLNGLSRYSTNKNNILKEKDALEKILRHNISGICQYTPKHWGSQHILNFAYGAIVPAQEDIRNPFNPYNDNFTAIPITITDKILFKKFKNVEHAWSHCLKIINTIQETRSLLTILWNQRVFNKLEYPAHVTIYEKLIQESKKRNAVFCTGNEILRYHLPRKEKNEHFQK